MALRDGGQNGTDAHDRDIESWIALLQASCGRYTAERADPHAFAGWVRPLRVFGLTAVDIAGNVSRVERTRRDARIDSIDEYAVLVLLAGHSTMSQNDQTVRLAAGDVVLIDKARPVTYVGSNDSVRWLSVQLPRHSLVTHLGFEPKGGACRRDSLPAARLFRELVLNGLDNDAAPFSPGDSYMQLAIYDLIGALFADDPWSASRPSDKLFNRVRGVIGDRFTDPDFGPNDVAINAGISLRYVHKLFTERGASCCQYIYSLRLDHALRLLQRRPQVGRKQPLSEIAYASGFRDYTHFARRFRDRFGRSPGQSVADAGHIPHAMLPMKAEDGIDIGS